MCTESVKWTNNRKVISVLLQQLQVAHIIKTFPASYAEMNSFGIRVGYHLRERSLRNLSIGTDWAIMTSEEM
jgi:hypothetical protein